MMSSQKSYQSKLGKFSGGLEIIKGTTVYNPGKEELKIASLEQLKTDTETKNALVISTGTDLKTLRNERRFMTFNSNESDVNCLENLYVNGRNFVKAEFTESSAAYQKINSITKKIRPVIEKKEPPEDGSEPAKSKSSSEKSFQSMVGFGNDIYTIITGLGEKYNPTNENIKPENLKAKIDRLAALNADIIKAEQAYNNAVKDRRELYEKEYGISKIISKIKDYLLSFEGGKKNQHYIDFSNAVK